MISRSVIIPQDRLDPLTDPAGGHDHKGHDTGDDCVDTDRRITAIFSELPVIHQTDQPHCDLGDFPHARGKG